MTENRNNLSKRCVVLVPLDRTDAAHHTAHKFELQPSIEHEPVLAMAELCLQVADLRANQPWCKSTLSAHLILVHTQKLADIDQLVAAIQKYLPSVTISELRDGRIEKMENSRAVVDSLGELPIVQSEEIDVEELSMLLDSKPREVEE
jgi:hypothetical protein